MVNITYTIVYLIAGNIGIEVHVMLADWQLQWASTNVKSIILLYSEHIVDIKLNPPIANF